MLTKEKLFLPTIFLALIIILSACQSATSGEAQTAAQEPTAITVMLDWVPNTNHTGLFVAQEKGWYEENGLAVNIIQPGETGVEQAVASGSAEFGISYQEGVTMARAEEVPIVSIAAVIQHNTSGFASRAEEGIEGPQDFEGKTYGSFGSPVEKPILDLLMSCAGGDVEQVKFIDTGYADFLSITERDVDFAWIFYGWDGINADLKGIDLNVVMLNDWQECVPDYYTPVIITNETLISEQPEIVEDFLAATARGYTFAIEHPDEAAEILLAAAPESDAELIKASQQWLSDQYQADAPQWGVQSDEVWQRYSDWLADQGILSESIDGTAAFSNAFLPTSEN
ncbi:MAG: ABC transporter substrate-binding protein [Anaerolineae bacterium]|nr:ABC transporter substrate-binding protein [Anaerolineae bacterium]MCB9105750.1 ABC transporter substrate-binding protein [Anaerolineales bacterium]